MAAAAAAGRVVARVAEREVAREACRGGIRERGGSISHACMQSSSPVSRWPFESGSMLPAGHRSKRIAAGSMLRGRILPCMHMMLVDVL